MALVGETEAAKKRAISIIITPYRSVFSEIANKAGTAEKNKVPAKLSANKQTKKIERKTMNKAKTLAFLVTFSDKR